MSSTHSDFEIFVASRKFHRDEDEDEEGAKISFKIARNLICIYKLRHQI